MPPTRRRARVADVEQFPSHRHRLARHCCSRSSNLADKQVRPRTQHRKQRAAAGSHAGGTADSHAVITTVAALDIRNRQCGVGCARQIGAVLLPLPTHGLGATDGKVEGDAIAHPNRLGGGLPAHLRRHELDADRARQILRGQAVGIGVRHIASNRHIAPGWDIGPRLLAQKELDPGNFLRTEPENRIVRLGDNHANVPGLVRVNVQRRPMQRSSRRHTDCGHLRGVKVQAESDRVLIPCGQQLDWHLHQVAGWTVGGSRPHHALHRQRCHRAGGRAGGIGDDEAVAARHRGGHMVQSQ